MDRLVPGLIPVFEDQTLPYALYAVQAALRRTVSGAYVLPGTFSRKVFNAALRWAPLVPGPIARGFLRKHRPYQVQGEEANADSQGISWKKWRVLDIPENLAGKSLLDVGCAEGLFCLESARRGASRVVGIDARFTALLSGTFQAKQERLAVAFRIGVFPQLGLRDRFDYVLCLSVLHHLVSSKDIWKVLNDQAYADDLEKLRESLAMLRTLTAPGGRCVVEIPFEYEDEESRRAVNFDRFNQELVKAGFSSSRYLGTWEHAARNQSRKDRPIYSAQG